MDYTPISFKSDYSLLKTLLKIKDIVDYAKSKNSKYAGILDDNPYYIMDFYDKCEKNDLNCICGMVVKIGENKIFLYIKDYIGYKNIIKINELEIEKKLTIDNLFKFNEGLICVLPYESYNFYNRFKTVFDTYLGYKNQYELKNAGQISKKLLFINEVLCIKKEDVKLLKLLYKIAGTNYDGENNYILEATEFDIGTISKFQENISLKFDFSKRYIPSFCSNKEESRKYLWSLAISGLKKRLSGNVSNEYKKRLEYELSVIDKMGFIDYFLIVYDYVKFAKKNNIMVGPGRGSAAGSLVAYTLGITDIDPLKYDLLFERFLNPERVTMPDIDMDFEDIKRGEVIDYVRSKYGEKRVALIVAYGTLGSRQVLRDVGKILEIDNKLIDELSKSVDAKKTLQENLKSDKLVSYIKEHNFQNYYKISMRLEGLKRHTTIHAAGVVISSENLLDLIPTFHTSDGVLTGYTMEYLEKLGLLKMDFLALRNLTIIHNILNLIHKTNSAFNLNKIPLDDAKTFEIFKKANTDNVFQFESAGMKNFLKKLNPDNFDDLVAANALFRPGPMENIDEYIARRSGKKKIVYQHPDLEPILKNTYGIIVYQEQIMQILSKMAGYSFAEADLIRRAMSKKKKDVMEKEKSRFIERSIQNGYTSNCATEVYELIVKFANYGFNKSHSVAYAFIGYQMAYLKAHYLDLFHLNTLNMNLGSELKTKEVIEDAKNKGLKIVRPSINESKYEYVLKDGTIVLPLTTIKNISSAANRTIVENAPYTDYFDFFKKNYGNNVNRMTIETLIKAGALDCFGKSKNTLLENIDSAITYVELCKNLDESLIMKPELVESNKADEEYSEIDIFGFYITGHPAGNFKDKNIVKITNMKNFLNRIVTMILMVEKIKVINTKKGEKMAFVDVSDETGSASAVIFPKNNNLIDKLEVDKLVMVKASLQNRNDEIQIIINDILPIKKDS